MAQSIDNQLTDKEVMFAREYVANGYNATKAALTAGYSKASASTLGSRMLRKVHVWQYVKSLMKDNPIDAEWIDAQYGAMAGSDTSAIAQMLKSGATIEEIQAAGHDTRQIRRLKWDKDGNFVDVEFYDRDKALEKMGRFRAMFSDRIEHEHAMNESLTQLIANKINQRTSD